MLCKLLLFALLVSVCEGKKQADAVISGAVESAPKPAGEGGASDVAPTHSHPYSQVPLGLGVRPPSMPLQPYPQPPPMPRHPYPRLPINNGRRQRPPCPPPRILPRRPDKSLIIRWNEDDSYEINPIKQCITDCWVKIGAPCNDALAAVARKAYADCINECYDSDGQYYDFALWQAF